MDRQTIDHTARLARLAVQDADRTRYEGQLAAILGHFEALRRALPTVADGAPARDAETDPATSRPASASPEQEGGRTRPDVVTPDRPDGVALVLLAADHEDRNFRVPRVLE